MSSNADFSCSTRPCMELVVWKPPADFIQHVYNYARSDNEETKQVS
jgi:hypothetical protein